jgi:hypothetical protein
MTNLYTQFETDKKAEEDGVRIVFGAPEDKNAPAFIISRLGERNRKFQKMMASMTKPYKRQIDNDTMDPEMMTSIFMTVFVKTCLKGWENVKGRPDKSGKAKDIEFSVENAMKLFKDLPDLYNSLVAESNKAATFLVEDLDETVKNS